MIERKKFQDYQNIETLVNEGLHIAMSHVLADDSLDVILSYLGKILKADRVYIFEKNARGNDDNTYEWAREGVSEEKENLQDVPAEVCANWYQDFSEGKITIIKDLEDIKNQNQLLYEVLKVQNISSIVTVPLFEDGVPIGFYGVDNPPEDMLDYTVNLLQMMGYFVLALLRQRNLQKELLHMSYNDDLTKVGNRRFFADTIQKMTDEDAVGFVYCDVTGLKRLNDSEGHQAGDKLLLQVTSILKEVFSKEQIFRLGGDEFVVLFRSSDYDLFQDKVLQIMFQHKILQLRELSIQRQVNLAIGSSWVQNPGNKLIELLSEAEEKMYQDKAEFYRCAGIDRRK
ncbi:MAG: diguanylate cyclase [Treponema sp.]|nr:diguanylate cyclase [Treponema sp.]MDY4674160.1 diguanylate cyclase [Treponema sp.]